MDSYYTDCTVNMRKNNCIMYIARWNMGHDDGELNVSIWYVLKDFCILPWWSSYGREGLYNEQSLYQKAWHISMCDIKSLQSFPSSSCKVHGFLKYFMALSCALARQACGIWMAGERKTPCQDRTIHVGKKT